MACCCFIYGTITLHQSVYAKPPTLLPARPFFLVTKKSNFAKHASKVKDTTPAPQNISKNVHLATPTRVFCTPTGGARTPSQAMEKRNSSKYLLMKILALCKCFAARPRHVEHAISHALVKCWTRCWDVSRPSPSFSRTQTSSTRPEPSPRGATNTAYCNVFLHPTHSSKMAAPSVCGEPWKLQ